MEHGQQIHSEVEQQVVDVSTTVLRASGNGDREVGLVLYLVKKGPAMVKGKAFPRILHFAENPKPDVHSLTGRLKVDVARARLACRSNGVIVQAGIG